MKIAVIGAGFFGCSIAIKIKEKFKKAHVHLFEKNSNILYSASGKNQFRLHMGYHYPRSEKTIRECQESIFEFEKYYKNCFIKSENYYAIARNNSKLNFKNYIDILEKNKLPYKIKKNKIFNYKNIESSIITDEKLINIFKVRKKTFNLIYKNNIDLRLNTKIKLSNNLLKNYDAIFLTTYDNNNNNLQNITIKKEKYFYQLVEKIIVKSPAIFNSFSGVILDGPFMCLDPYYMKGYSILGNVRKSVIQEKIRVYNTLETNYMDKINQYLVTNQKSSNFNEIKKHFSNYFLNTVEMKYYGSFYVIRCTKKSSNDERLTNIKKNKNLFCIYSGKWINSFKTAEEILKLL